MLREYNSLPCGIVSLPQTAGGIFRPAAASLMRRARLDPASCGVFKASHRHNCHVYRNPALFKCGRQGVHQVRRLNYQRKGVRVVRRNQML